MIRPANLLLTDITNIQDDKAHRDRELLDDLAQVIYNLIDTIHHDMDDLTDQPIHSEHGYLQDRVNQLEYEVRNLMHKQNKLVDDLLGRHNKLADEVKEMKRVFEYIMERKLERKGVD